MLARLLAPRSWLRLLTSGRSGSLLLAGFAACVACSGNASSVTSESNPTLVVVGQDVLTSFGCLDEGAAGAAGSSGAPRAYVATLTDVSAEFGAAGAAGAAAATLTAPAVACGREVGFGQVVVARRYTAALRFYGSTAPKDSDTPLFTVRCGDTGLPDALGVDADGKLVSRAPGAGAGLGPITAVSGVATYVRGCVRE